MTNSALHPNLSMDEITLIKRLISIPSYVDSNTNEVNIGEFVYNYLKKFPWLVVEKQKISNRRFNVFAKDNSEIDFLIIGHIDTVQPQSAWTIPPFNPTRKGNKLFGLGSTDMKGSIASILSAIAEVGPTKGVGYLFYADEEYSFLGIKKFLNQYRGNLPKIILSGDGSNLSFGLSCRGLIEVDFTIQGKSGHAADPQSGNNAILAAVNSIKQLQNIMKKLPNEKLGKTTINIAAINGGLKQKSIDNKTHLGNQGNIIADYCAFKIELRTANDISATDIVKLVKKGLAKQDCKLESYTIVHDLGYWMTKKQQVEKITSAYDKPIFVPASKRGYIDLQMIWQKFDNVPCLTFGPGEPGQAHAPNEYIKVDKLTKAKLFFIDVMKQYEKK